MISLLFMGTCISSSLAFQNKFTLPAAESIFYLTCCNKIKASMLNTSNKNLHSLSSQSSQNKAQRNGLTSQQNSFFYDNGTNSRSLTGLFLSSISEQTHEFIVYAMRQRVRADNFDSLSQKTNGGQFFMCLSCY